MLGSLLRRLLRAAYAVRLVGRRDALSGASPLLIVANHPTTLAPALLAAAITRDATVIASRHAMRNPWVRLALSGLDIVVADLSEAMTVRKIARLIARGRSVFVFPENRPTRSGAPTKIYEAPAIVAARTGVSVLYMSEFGVGPT